MTEQEIKERLVQQSREQLLATLNRLRTDLDNYWNAICDTGIEWSLDKGERISIMEANIREMKELLK